MKDNGYLTESIGDRVSADRFRWHPDYAKAKAYADNEVESSAGTEVVVYRINAKGKLEEVETVES